MKALWISNALVRRASMGSPSRGGALALVMALGALSFAGCIEERAPLPGGRGALPLGDVPPHVHGLATPTPAPTPSGEETPTQAPTPTETTPETPTPSASPSIPTPSPSPTPGPTEDADGDGFTLEGGDCDDAAPAVFPGAQDLPYDGIDANCNGLQDWGETVLGVRLDGYGDPLRVRIGQLEDVALGPDGALYFSDLGLCLIRRLKEGVVTTVAGNGICGSAGEVVLGTEGPVSAETLAMDGVRGRLYFSEFYYDRVRYLDLATGLVHPYLGDGVPGNPEDGELAQTASVCQPSSLAVDPQTGTLFFEIVKSSIDGCIAGTWRAVNTGGEQVLVLKVAGNGECDGENTALALESSFCPSGVTIAPGGDSLFATSIRFEDQDSLWRIDAIVGGQPGLTRVAGDLARSCDPPSTQVALGESLCQPEDPLLAPDGSVFFGQRGGTVLRYVPEGEALEWVAGQGIPRGELAPLAQRGDSDALFAPLGAITGLAWDGTAEGIYLADQGTGLIRWLRLNTPEPGIDWVFDLAGLKDEGYRVGAAQDVQLNQPFAVDTWVDPEDGEEVVFVTDLETDVLLELRGGLVRRLAGQPGVEVSGGDGGPAVDATLRSPYAVSATPSGALYLLEYNRLRLIQDGDIETVAGDGVPAYSPDGTPASEASLNGPGDVLVNPDGGSLYITEGAFGRIRRFPLLDGRPQALDTLAGGGDIPLSEVPPEGVPALDALLSGPDSLALHGDALYFVQSGGGMVARIDGEGLLRVIAAPEGVYGGGDETVVSLPSPAIAVAVDPWGEVYVLGQNDVLYQLRQDRALRLMGVEGMNGYLRDEAPASTLPLNTRGVPKLAFKGDGTLLIPSAQHNVIRALFF